MHPGCSTVHPRLQHCALCIQATPPGLLRQGSTVSQQFAASPVQGPLSRPHSLPRISTAEIRASLGTPPYPLVALPKLPKGRAAAAARTKLSMYQTTAPNPFALKRVPSPPRTPPRPRPSSPAWNYSRSPARSLP